MIPGYHTSAFVEHDLATAGSVLRRIGFGAVAIRLSLGRLDPLADHSTRVWQVGMLQSGIRGLDFVLDADGAFLVDPWLMEPPSLVERSAESDRQLEYLISAIELAGELGGGQVTFASGRMSQELGLQGSLDRLAEVVQRVTASASKHGVRVSIRPRTGHLVDTIGGYERLLEWVGSGCSLKLAADVGVMVVGGEMPILDLLGRVGDRLGCVYLSDMKITEGSGEPMLGSGHVSVRRVVAGLAGLKGLTGSGISSFDGPVLLEPVVGQGMDPGAAATLFEQVFRVGGQLAGEREKGTKW